MKNADKRAYLRAIHRLERDAAALAVAAEALGIEAGRSRMANAIRDHRLDAVAAQ